MYVAIVPYTYVANAIHPYTTQAKERKQFVYAMYREFTYSYIKGLYNYVHICTQ